MFIHKLSRITAVRVSAFVLYIGFGWFAYQTLASSQLPSPGVKADGPGADDPGDTKQTTRRTWDSARDFPPPIASDTTVKYDYPIVYVRVPRPYPKAYYGINHLNQAGLHQTNAPGAELLSLHPDGRDESLVSVEPQESITDPMVSLDGQWVYYAKFHHMTTGATASMTVLQSRKGADIYKIHVPTRKVVQLTSQQRTPNTEPLTRILIGMHDYGTGIDPESFTVTVDFPIDGVKPGENLAGKFKPTKHGVNGHPGHLLPMQ